MNKKDGKMQIVYHGTTEANAKKILKTGFKPGTFFATHLENSMPSGEGEWHFAGNYVFEVAVESDRIPKPSPDTYSYPRQPWEFIATDRVPPSQIVRLQHHPKLKVLKENKKLSNEIFRSTLAEFNKARGVQDKPHVEVLPESRMQKGLIDNQPRRVMPAKQTKISRGVYADTKGQRISRRPHRHWKRIY